MNILFILNDPPYGTERSYNGLRMAKALLAGEASVSVFLLADAITSGVRMPGRMPISSNDSSDGRFRSQFGNSRLKRRWFV